MRSMLYLGEEDPFCDALMPPVDLCTSSAAAAESFALLQSAGKHLCGKGDLPHPSTCQPDFFKKFKPGKAVQ